MNERADVVVVGAGAVGCAVAWALAREGVSVAVLERDAIGAHASRVAAGMLAPFAEAHGEDGSVPLGAESLAAFPDVARELTERGGLDPHLSFCGVLRVARDETSAARLRARAGGFGLEAWDADTARAHAPMLGPDVRGALWSPREGHVDAERLTRTFARAAASCGARFAIGEPALALLRDRDAVTGVRSARRRWSAAHVVLASGAWAGIGLEGAPPLAVRPVRGQLATLRGARLPSILWDDAIYLVPRADGGVTAGATVEDAGFDCRVTSAGVRWLLECTARLVPALGGAAFEGARAGLRPATPDGLPLVGHAPGAPGLVLSLGHHRNGILLSATTGSLIADLVQGRALPAAARGFRPDRFAAPARVAATR